MHLYESIYASGRIPSGWTPIRGGTIKYPARPAIQHYLRTLLAGRWRKVVKQGTTGEVHFFEHESGRVAGVKYY